MQQFTSQIHLALWRSLNRDARGGGFSYFFFVFFISFFFFFVTEFPLTIAVEKKERVGGGGGGGGGGAGGGSKFEWIVCTLDRENSKLIRTAPFLFCFCLFAFCGVHLCFFLSFLSLLFWLFFIFLLFITWFLPVISLTLGFIHLDLGQQAKGIFVPISSSSSFFLSL